MKELLILRHAKSSWKHHALQDHDRPLSERGLRDAPRMGRLLAGEGLVPDLILTSPAVRALATARLVADACGSSDPPLVVPELYLEGAVAYADVLRRIPGGESRVLVVGHSPDVESLVAALTGEDEPMPTAALARVLLAIDRWSDLDLDGSASLAAVWRPKSFADGGG